MKPLTQAERKVRVKFERKAGMALRKGNGEGAEKGKELFTSSDHFFLAQIT